METLTHEQIANHLKFEMNAENVKLVKLTRAALRKYSPEAMKAKQDQYKVSLKAYRAYWNHVDSKNLQPGKNDEKQVGS